MENTMEERITKEYAYKGKILGKTIAQTRGYPDLFVPEIEEFEVYELLMDMPISDKLHIRKKAPGVLKLSQHYRFDLDSYISDEELVTYVTDNGFRNKTELYHGDHQAWKLVKKRNLESKLFPELSKADVQECPASEEMDSILF